MSLNMSTDQEYMSNSGDDNDQTRQYSNYASFGDEGVTATANSHGHLLQITRHLGNQPSGFFCVDLFDTLSPFSATRRMQKLQEHYGDPHAGMKLDFENSEDIDAGSWRANTGAPELKFVHNRWPRFDTETPIFNISVQYVVTGKIVYQIYKFELRQGKALPSKMPPLVINANMLLRDMGFTIGSDEDDHDLRDKSSQQPPSGETYSDCLSPGNDYIIRSRTIYKAGDSNQDAITLFITPFINKDRQILELGSTPGYYQLILEPAALKRLGEDGLEITLAYQLELTPSGEIGFTHPISHESFSEAQNMLKVPVELPKFTEDHHLNLSLGRTLEHILSVCSIPVAYDANGDNPSIALTCGDISGHRISTTASFYSFRFLLLALEYMGNQTMCVYKSDNGSSKDSHASEMQSRIQKTCRGHLKWLYESAKLDKGLFAPSHLISGAPIFSQHHSSSLWEKSLFNTPFQVIKAAEFCRVTAADERMKSEIANDFREIVKDWIEALDKKNKERHFAFPNVRDETEQWIFDLSDHALLWWAIKATEDLGLGAELEVNKVSGLIMSQPVMVYSSKNVQTNVLKKFTIQHPLLQQSLVAVSRSCSETKFQLQAKDTVLFYAMDIGLFNLYDANEGEIDIWENKTEAWRCTVDYQKECDDGQRANRDWEQPLNFALALIMSSKNKQINAQSISEIERGARKILLHSCSSNGLFPGQLDENGRPSMFKREDMKEVFWRASFEIPYILLRYQTSQSANEDVRLSDSTSTPLSHHVGASLSVLSTVPTTLSITNETVRNEDMSKPSSEVGPCYDSRFMKHGVFFTNAIDRKHIVEILDEWLYNEPRFFNFHATLTPEIISEFLQEVYKLHPRKPPKDGDAFSETDHSWLWRMVNKRKARRNAIAEAISMKRSGICTMKVVHEAALVYDLNYQTELLGYIIDVPRVKHCKEMDVYLPIEISSTESLLNHVKIKRTPAVAKKRIFHFFYPKRYIVPIYYLSSSERKEISSFFDRHASLNPYFFEDTTRTLNKWITEFHLPFYQMLSLETTSDLASKGLSDIEGRNTISNPKVTQFPHPDLNGNTKSLIQAIISFRFDGDLLDRYWTCHLMENCPQNMGDPKKISFNITTYPVNGALKPNPWRQRRVLELILFERILKEILRSTQEIFEEEKSVFKASKFFRPGGWGSGSAESKMKPSNQQIQSTTKGGDVFLSNDKLWYKIQAVLQEVEEDLSENLAKIKLWLHREDKRGPDKPRWTHKDEYNYGGAIHKLKASNNFYIEELERCSAKISAFNMQLTREMDNARSYWEIQTTNDVRLFTYVTVVFLPISFATGIFSMSGIPSRHMLLNMTVTAFVALLVTTIALVSAKSLRAMIQFIRYKLPGLLARSITRRFKSTMDNTQLVFMVIIECAFVVTRGVLHVLNKVDSNLDRDCYAGPHKVLSSSIYLLARYLYFPLKELLPDMTLDDMDHPWSLSKSDKHPIKLAHDSFKAARS